MAKARLDRDGALAIAERLPPMSATVHGLIGTMNRDDWEIEEVAGIVARDPAVTMKLLKEANSATRRGQRTIDQVQEAILRIGPAALLSQAIAISARGQLTEGEFGIWKRSVAAARAVELASTVGVAVRRLPLVAPAAALLHDFGLLVLQRHARTRRVATPFYRQGLGGEELLAREQETFGIDHAEIGTVLAERWNLPDGLRDGITHHHRPDDTADLVSDLVHLSGAIADVVVDGRAEKGLAAVAPGVAARLALDEAVMMRLAATVARQLGDSFLRSAS